jgi:hypothetical protein
LKDWKIAGRGLENWKIRKLEDSRRVFKDWKIADRGFKVELLLK